MSYMKQIRSKNKMKLTGFLLIALLFGCSLEKDDEINGMWLMYKVVQNGKDVTSEHDPYKERYVIINSDSTFKSGGRPFGENAGKYTYNSTDKTLFLDSDTGPEDDSYWKVNFKGDTMQWEGYGSEWAEDFVLIQIRAKD